MRSLSEYQVERYGSPLVLNLGCGRTNQKEFYGIDILSFPGVDLVADLSHSIPVPEDTFDVVIARDFLEHIPQGQPNIKIMEEIFRVLKPKGVFEFEVPSTDGCNKGAFQDPTHLSWWNQEKFNYFLDDEYGKGFRSLYDIKCHFKPKNLLTYNNQWGVTYVAGSLEK